MKKITLVLFFFLPFLLFSQKQLGRVAEKVQSTKIKPGKFKTFDVFKSGFEQARNNYSDAVEEGVIVTLDEARVAVIYNEDPQQMEIIIPFKTNGETVTLELYQKDIFSPDFKAMTSDGQDITDIIDRGKHYRGMVSGKSQSLVSISIFRNEIIGFISYGEGNYTIGKLRDSNSKHIIYKDSNLRNTEEFNCFMEDDGIGYTTEEITYTGTRDPSDCVNVYVEAGQSVYNSFGGNLTNTTNFLNGVFGQSYVLYANEGITMQTSSMFIWTTPDPYNSGSTGGQLGLFQANTGAFTGDIGHLVEVQNIGGQAAGFSGICNPITDNSLCFSGFSGTGYNTVPTFSFNVQILTHEMGHLLGSRHTHACVWNGNSTAIDSCSGFTEGSCALPGSPAGGGTIMSYCHNDPVGIDFTQGFGPQPGAVILNTVNAPGNCLVGCSPPGSNDLCVDAVNMNYGATVSGSTIGATFDNVGFCGTANTAPGVWYTFTGDGNSTNLSTCNQANYDTKITVFDGNCGALNCVAGQDDATGCAGFTTSLDFCTTNGTDYLVLVHGFSSDTGNFDLTLTSNPSGPTISCPAPIIQNNDAGVCGAVINFTTPVGTDDCPGVVITQTAGLASGATFPVGTTTNTFEVTDAAGNSATCSFDVTINDTEDPTISCPANITQNNDPGECGAVVTYADPTISDNCPFPSSSSTLTTTFASNNGAAGNMFDITAINDITINSFDVNMNSGITETVEIYYKTGSYVGFETNAGAWTLLGSTTVASAGINIPTPLNMSLGQNVTAGQTVGFYVTLTNNNIRYTDGTNSYSDANLTLTAGVGKTYPFGSTFSPRTWNGNIIYSTGGGAFSQTAGLPSGSTFPVGTTTNTFEVTDVSGNTNSCTQVITVEDNEDPTWTTAPNNMTVECDGTPDPSGAFAAWLTSFSGTDNCGTANVTNDSTGLSDDCGDTGTETVTFTLDDGNGNSITQDATFIIEDTTDPIIGCPGDVTAFVEPGSCGAIVIFGDAVGLDDCGSVIVAQTGGLGSGSVFPVGDTIVEFTAIDECFNTSICTFIITVIDNELPIAVCNDLTIVLDEFGNASITAGDIDGVSTDNCGIASIAIDVDTFDCSDVGENDVVLTVTDVNGNISTCTATVTIQDLTAPEVFCQDITVQLDSNGEAIITGLDIDNGSNDACGIASYELTTDIFYCNNIGENTIFLHVTDVNGNESSCMATVTVEDTIAPVLVCVDATIELDENGEATIDPLALSLATDNCGIDVLIADLTDVDCSDIGTPINVTIFATDASGNTSGCTLVVTVVDLLAPVLVCPTVDPTMVDPNGTFTLPDYIASGEATATDNCTDPVTAFTQDPAAGTILGVGVHTITFTAEDEYGNVATCSFDLDLTPLGNQDNELTNSNIILYPNPANNIVYLNNPQSLDLESMSIYDLTGRLVQKVDLRTMGTEISLDVSKFANATYMVIISSQQGGTITKSLIVYN